MITLKHYIEVIKRKWMQLAHFLGVWNTRIVLTFLYFTIVGVYAIIMRLIIFIKPKARQAAWVPMNPLGDVMKHLERQF